MSGLGATQNGKRVLAIWQGWQHSSFWDENATKGVDFVDPN